MVSRLATFLLVGFSPLLAAEQNQAARPPPLAKAAPTFRDRLIADSSTLEKRLPQATAMAIAGKLEESNAYLVATFPEANRTPVEKLVLANALFRMDPSLSYALHQQVAAALPHESAALLEWALEQHRAKHYAEAARTYSAYSAQMPEHAPILGLAAECAIRTGNISAAVSLWQASERATQGSVENFESLVCEINSGPSNELARSEFIRRLEKGDETAATALLLLDADWPIDWWNRGPNDDRLKNDLPRIKRAYPIPGPDLSAALCVAESSLITADESDVRRIMLHYHFLIDERATLPSSGKALSELMVAALGANLFTEPDALARFGPRILALARTSKDPDTYFVASHFYQETKQGHEIDREAWDITHDFRFARASIIQLVLEKKLTLNDPLLQRALREFPENAEIAAAALAVAGSNPAVRRPLLVNAIKAEYTHFSSFRPGVDFPRPSAYPLQRYFAELDQLAQ